MGVTTTMSDCTKEPPRTLLREFKNVRQEPGSRRRWFDATDLELIVWYDSAGTQTGFQLIYWLPDGERALTWRNSAGFKNCRVDTGDASPLKNMSPVLQADGVVPWSYLEELFRQRAESLEPSLCEHVQTRLQARGGVQRDPRQDPLANPASQQEQPPTPAR